MWRGSGLSDGQWHAVRLVAKENFAMLTVDGDEASAVRTASPLSITTGGTYHLGGVRTKEGGRGKGNVEEKVKVPGDK
ncbi:hypothetical protein CRUP_027401 [Coryphaenoides rupestris]|nr:hypothetical protein CRUP_027401 [Coryphaenoides rupestris]